MTELTARLRGVPSRRVPGLGTSQLMARTLIGVAALLFVAAPNVTGAAPAAATPTDFAASAATNVVSLDVTLTSTGSVAALPERTTGTERPSHLTPAAHADRATSSPAGTSVRPHRQARREPLVDRNQHLGEGSRFTEISSSTATCSATSPASSAPAGCSASHRHHRHRRCCSGPRHHTVQSGDTLTSVATDLLGDPSRYLEIFNASTSTIQDDGSRLTDPDLIRPGWRLTIPQSTSSGARAAASDPQPRHHSGDHSDADAGGDLTSEGPDDDEDLRDESTFPSGLNESPRPHEESTTDLDERHTRTGAATTPRATAVSRVGDDLVGEEDDSVLSSPWFVRGLAGGGMLLAGALLLALRTRRSSQFRTRRQAGRSHSRTPRWHPSRSPPPQPPLRRCRWSSSIRPSDASPHTSPQHGRACRRWPQSNSATAP